MMKVKLYLLGCLILVVFTTRAQTWPQYEKINEKTGEEIVAELKNFAVENGLPELIIDLLIRHQYDVEAYRIIYKTRAADPYMQEVTASGVVFVPTGIDHSAPIAAYLHGTIGSEDEAPSRVAALTSGSGGTLIEDQTLFGWILATDGYIAVMPDYIGLGDDDLEKDLFHPFLHARSEAQATIDMLYAVQAFLSTDHPTAFQNRLFLSGYSQGGHAVLATQRAIEQDRDHSAHFNIAVSIPASGPYCLSSIQRKFLINTPGYSNPAHLPYLIFGYQEAYGGLFYPDLTKVFVNEPGPVYELYDDQLTIAQINDELQTMYPGLADNWMTMFTPRFRKHFTTNWCFWRCPPIITALRDNDVINWRPKATTRLLFCYGDEVVAAENTLAAYLIFGLVKNARDVLAISLGNNGHNECAVPALMLTKFLFDARQNWKSKLEKSEISYEEINEEEALRSLNNLNIYNLQDLKREVLNQADFPAEPDSLKDRIPVDIYPNPAFDHVYIDIPGLTKGLQITLYDVTGRNVLSHQVKSQTTRLDISGLHGGMYLIHIRRNGEIYIRKLIKN